MHAIALLLLLCPLAAHAQDPAPPPQPVPVKPEPAQPAPIQPATTETKPATTETKPATSDDKPAPPQSAPAPAAAPPAQVQSAAANGVMGHVKPEVTGVSLSSVDTEKAVFTVALSVTSDRPLTLDGIDVTQLRLNTLPVFASPLPGPIKLEPGKAWVPPAPLTVTVYLRDITSLDPLSDAVRTGAVVVEGELFARVQLKMLQRLAMFESHATVPVKLRQQVPLEVPGGDLGKMSAQLLLSAADAALKQVRGPMQRMGGGLRKKVFDEDAGAIVAIRTTYRIADAAHVETEATWKGMGFFAGPKQLVTVAEALEPWTFDAELCLALKEGRYTIVPNSVTVEATTSTGSKTLLVGTDLTAGKVHNLKKREVVEPRDSGGPLKAQVVERADLHNIVILTVNGPWTPETQLHASTSTAASPWPETVALRRGVPTSPTEPALDPLQLPASAEAGRLKLGSMVDASVFGSPLIGPDGVLGMVQDESTGILWADILKELGPT